jgi:hypothetical protein
MHPSSDSYIAFLIRKASMRAAIRISDLAVTETNKAFAVQALVCCRDFDVDAAPLHRDADRQGIAMVLEAAQSSSLLPHHAGESLHKHLRSTEPRCSSRERRDNHDP